MTTKLQNKVWSVLPKEFKEEVKNQFRDGFNDDRNAIGRLFGIDNLLSDAEGEEMLCVKASTVKDIYDSMNKAHPKESVWVVKQTLEALFGSKCPPDEKKGVNIAKIDKTIMETRNVSVTLEKAKEWYNSGNTTLKEVALQAFTKEELTTPKYSKIRTFEDACNALGLYKKDVELDLKYFAEIEGGFCNHLTAIYKLDIIRKALNGANWNPKLDKGDIYVGWVRFYKKSFNIAPDSVVIGNIITGEKEYTVVADFGNKISWKGIGCFCDGFGYGDSSADLGLLCCRNIEIAKYMSKQFGKIIFDACYAHHVGSYRWL